MSCMLSIVQNNWKASRENTTILWEPGSRKTPVYYEEVKARIIVNPSHCLAWYVFHRDNDDRFLGYAWYHYQFSCNEVQDVFCKVIAEMDIEYVIQHLIAVDQGSKS